jgi:metallo-beta-lactamase family protein
MDLHLLGAAGCVTGSRTLITVDGATALIDCGLFQGFKALRARNWKPMPLPPRSIDAVLLTHAHIDHSGYLPRLIAEGFRGPAWCTEATADLCGLLLPDSGYLQEEDARFANKHGYSRHSPAQPLYTEAQARAALDSLAPVPWGEPVRVGPLTATFQPAGHILGASMIHVRGPSGSVLFSGDLGRPDDLLMHPPADVTDPPDLLVLESTYGDRRHATDDPLDALQRVVTATIGRGGTVVIPTFAVGRAQSLLLGLHRLIESGRLPADLPIFLNSPMAVDATALYLKHSALHRLSAAECRALSRAARLVRTVEDSRRLNEDRSPKVILSASGMLTGGRVLHHLAAFAPDPKNTLLFVGFQASGTRGAAIVAGAESVKVHGEQVPIRCEVARIDAWSAHADADETLAWLRRWPAPPRHVLLNHGEPNAADALRQRIEEELGWPCTVGELGATVTVGKQASRPAATPVRARSPEEPRPSTPIDATLRSLGATAALVVLGGARVPRPADARRALTRAALETSERPDDPDARARLRIAERRAEHARWHDEASRLPTLAAEVPHLAIVSGAGDGLGRALGDASARSDVPFIDAETRDLRDPGLPGHTRAVVAFPGGLSTLATVYALLAAGSDRGGEPLPVVLVGRAFWHEVLDVERLGREGLIDDDGGLGLLYADTVDQAWSLLRGGLLRDSEASTGPTTAS